MAMEPVLLDEGFCLVYATARNGHCMFSAFAHQIFRFDIDSDLHEAMIMALREMTVEHITRCVVAGDVRYLHALSLRVDDAGLDVTFDSFLDILAKTNVWGGDESLLALSEIFECVINVYREGSSRICIDSDSAVEGRFVNIVYRGPLNAWDHYDSFSHFVSVSPAAVVVPVMSPASVIHRSSSTREIPSAASVCYSRSSSYVSSPLIDSLNVGSWNVRGCSQASKRTLIDECLHQKLLHVVFLQETKLAPGDYDSANYRWYLGHNDDKVIQYRGLVLLFHVSFPGLLIRVIPVTHNIVACEVHLQGELILFVNVHIPGDRHGLSEFQQLSCFLTKMSSHHIVVLGDFNAHIGKRDITVSDKRFVGPNLFHDVSNDNGEELINLLHMCKLSVKNTWSTSSSLLTTWDNCNSQSLIDHILCNSDQLLFSRMFATYVDQVSSDHKLLTTTIRFRPKPIKPKPRIQSTERAPDSVSSHSMKESVVMLRHLPARLHYQERLSTLLEPIADTVTQAFDTEHLWQAVQTAVTKAAADALSSKPPLSPRCLDAQVTYEMSKSRFNRAPFNVHAIRSYRGARKAKNLASARHVEDECTAFFANLDQVDINLRNSLTYKFIRRFKRKSQPRSRCMVTVDEWETS